MCPPCMDDAPRPAITATEERQMKRPNLISLILSLAFAAGCSEPAVAPLSTKAPVTIKAPALSKGAPPAKLTTVPLMVTISATDALGNPYKIQSDGQGSYTDGTQNVQAVLDVNGTFAFNTASAIRRGVLRWVNYNFDAPVDPTNTYRPNTITTDNYHFSTGFFAVPLQNLGVNGNPASECGYMGNGVPASWRVSFHKGLEDVSDSPTAFAVVTRTSVSPAIWTVTPSGSCSPNSNVAALRSGDGSILYGYYSLPFFFTLQAK